MKHSVTLTYQGMLKHIADEGLIELETPVVIRGTDQDFTLGAVHYDKVLGRLVFDLGLPVNEWAKLETNEGGK